MFAGPGERAGTVAELGRGAARAGWTAFVGAAGGSSAKVDLAAGTGVGAGRVRPYASSAPPMITIAQIRIGSPEPTRSFPQLGREINLLPVG